MPEFKDVFRIETQRIEELPDWLVLMLAEKEES